MVKRFKTFKPQSVVAEHFAGSGISLTNEQKLSLYKKSQKSGISTDILEEVYRRGYSIWKPTFSDTPEQFAFERVNSFVAGGFAAMLDEDLIDNLSEQTKKELDDFHKNFMNDNPNLYSKMISKYVLDGDKKTEADRSGKPYVKNPPPKEVYDFLYRDGDDEHNKKSDESLRRFGYPTKSELGNFPNSAEKFTNDDDSKKPAKVDKPKPPRNQKDIDDVINNLIAKSSREPKEVTPKKIDTSKTVPEKPKTIPNTPKWTTTKQSNWDIPPQSDKPASVEVVPMSAADQKKMFGPMPGQSSAPAAEPKAQPPKASSPASGDKKPPYVPITSKTMSSPVSGEPNWADRRRNPEQLKDITGIKGSMQQPSDTNADTVKNGIKAMVNMTPDDVSNAKTNVFKSENDEPRELTINRKKPVNEKFELDEVAKKFQNPTGGLNQAGRNYYNKKHGSNLKKPVTTPPSEITPGSEAEGRRNSFCARMSKVEGPKYKPNGEPTRKTLSLRKWNCHKEEAELQEKTCNCWDGYKRVPGTKPCAPGSCARPSAINEKSNGLDEVYSDKYMEQGRTFLKLKRAKAKAAKNPQDKITRDTSDELVKQFLAKGGKVNTIKESEDGKSKIGKTPGHMVSMEQPWNPEDPNAGHRKTFQKKMEKEQKEREKMQERYEGAEKTSKDFRKPNSRFVGSDELTKVYDKMTPKESTLTTIKRVIAEDRGAVIRLQKTLGVKPDGIIGPKTRAAVANSPHLSQNMNKPTDAPSTPKASEPVASKNDTKPSETKAPTPEPTPTSSKPKTPEMLVKKDSRNRSDDENLKIGIERQDSAVRKGAVDRLMKNNKDPIMGKYMSAGKHDDNEGRSNDIMLGSRHDGGAGLDKAKVKDVVSNPTGGANLRANNPFADSQENESGKKKR